MLGINAIKITPDILSQVAEIDEFKGLWTGLDKHTTGLHLLGDIADYGAQFERVLGPLKEQYISPQMVRILHAMQVGAKGESAYKDSAVPLSIPNKNSAVGALDTAEPSDVDPLLSKLCGWVNEALKGDLHPLLVAAVFVSVFLQISPFEEANLRTVRFLLILILLKAGYTYTPYVSLAPIMDKDGEAFYRALNHNQDSLEAGQPDWSQWLLFFLGVLKAQKDELYMRLYESKDDLSNLPALSARIMALFKEHERLQMKQIIKLTRGRRATIKLRLSELLEAGYLKRHGAGRGTWYSLV